MTEPTNVFEWHLEHSQPDSEDREIILWAAFKATGEPPSVHPDMFNIPHRGYQHVERLVTAGYLAFVGRKDERVWFPAYEAARKPHILTLSTWDGGPYEGEDAHIWDQATIECPHQPAAETMPCATWERCGCPADLAEIALYEGGEGDGLGPCLHSATGVHHYINGKPSRPVASCSALGWEASIADRAFEMGLAPGTHLVRPWWGPGPGVQLEIVKRQAVSTEGSHG